MLSAICREFGCRPSEAMREIDETPAGLLSEIMELRGFAAAWQHIMTVKSQDDLQMTPLVEFAMDVQVERVKRHRAEQLLAPPPPPKVRDKSRKRGEQPPMIH